MYLIYIDTDPGPQDLVLWQQQTNTNGLPSAVEEKGRRLSQEESTAP